MKLFGVQIGKEKVYTFQDFREAVRTTAKHLHPGAIFTISENGFTLTIEGRTQTCNLRGVYANYIKQPHLRDHLISSYLETLSAEAPSHSWYEASPLLRPSLRSKGFIQLAEKSLLKQQEPDSLPTTAFLGDLNVIVVSEWQGRIWAITQNILNGWGITVEEAMEQAMNNMGITAFPDVVNVYHSSDPLTKNQEVGLIVEGNHQTATWILFDRFRDYIGRRLQGSFIVSVPNRGRLVAIKEEQTALIANVQSSYRNYQSLPYPLTSQLYHVDITSTGGSVSIYDPVRGRGETVSSDNLFSISKAPSLPSISQAAAGIPLNRTYDSLVELNEPAEGTG